MDIIKIIHMFVINNIPYYFKLIIKIYIKDIIISLITNNIEFNEFVNILLLFISIFVCHTSQ